MKLLHRLTRSVVIAALGVSASVAFAFEGYITMQITAPKQKDPMTMNYVVKSPRLKIEIPTQENKKGDTGGMATIVNHQTMEAFILFEMGEKGQTPKKMYMKRNLQEDAERLAGKQAKPSAPPTKTGRSEKIAGYLANEYVSTNDKGEVTEMWLSKELGAFTSMPANPMGRGRGQPPSPEWEKFVKEEGAFPLRVLSRNKKGDETSRMEVTKVDKTSVPEKVFSLDGYEPMPSFGDMMKGVNPFAR